MERRRGSRGGLRSPRRTQGAAVLPSTLMQSDAARLLHKKGAGGRSACRFARFGGVALMVERGQSDIAVPGTAPFRLAAGSGIVTSAVIGSRWPYIF